MDEVSCCQFLANLCIFGAIGHDGGRLKLKSEDIELFLEIERIKEGQSVVPLHDVAVDFIVIEDGVGLDFLEEISRRQEHLSEVQGIALFGVVDEAGYELLDSHLF